MRAWNRRSRRMTYLRLDRKRDLRDAASDLGGTVDSPPLSGRRDQIRGDVVVHFPFSGATATGRRMICEIVGHDLPGTSLAAPFDELLLGRPGARRRSVDMAVVTAVTDRQSVTTSPT